MKKLRTVLFISIIVMSMFAFTGFHESISSVQAADVVGMHKVTVNYYKAYIINDHDIGTKGEWFFRLKAPLAASYTGETRKDTDSGEYANFADRIKSWYISGKTDFSFKMQAREKDKIPVWGGWEVDYTSTLTWNVNWRWPSQAIGKYYFSDWRKGDVVHYFAYKIANQKPTVYPISGPNSGYTGNYYRFSTQGHDNDLDSISFRWKIWKKSTSQYWYPTQTGSSLDFSFPTPGTYVVYVYARDALNTKSPTVSKEITIRSSDTITFTRVWTNKKIYKVGETITINAKIKKNGAPLTSGTVKAYLYALGAGKAHALISSKSMVLVNAAQGKWRTTYGPIPGPADPLGFEGTYWIRVDASAGWASAEKGVYSFVALRRTQSTIAKFLTASSPSRAAMGWNFVAKARIKNPSGSSQTLKVQLILPAGMTRVSGAATRTITLAPGAAKTFKWTLKATTTTNKLLKINVKKGTTVKAKLHWYIRMHMIVPPP